MFMAGLAIGSAGGLACRASEGGNAETQPVVSNSTRYDYSATDSQPAPVSARAVMHESMSQWPTSPEGRMESMIGRLERVAKVVSAAAGTHCIPRIGATERGVVATEDGVLEVDATVLWKLDEGGLAASVAHELAHRVLGHKTDLERIKRDRESGLAGSAQRERMLELAADEFAGRVVAKAHYRPESFVLALRRVPGAGVHSADVNQMYSADQRWAAFQRGYGEIAATTQPASQAE